MAAKQHPHSPNPDGGPWFIVDTKYPTAGAEYVLVSSDKVTFGVSDFALRHSNMLWHHANQPDDASSPVFYFEDPVLEKADTVRLLLDVLGGYRLPYWDDDAWPSPTLLLRTLQLARKHEFTMAYDLVVAYCQILVDRRADKSRHLVGMFRVAAILDDEQLAALCVARLSDENGATDVDVASWSAEHVAGIPTAYLWAYLRSVRTWKALAAGGMAHATVENVFRASLQAIKAQEQEQQLS